MWITSTNSKFMKSLYKIMNTSKQTLPKLKQLDDEQLFPLIVWLPQQRIWRCEDPSVQVFWKALLAWDNLGRIYLNLMKKSCRVFSQKQLHLGSLIEFSYCGICLTHWKQLLWCVWVGWQNLNEKLHGNVSNEYSLLIIADEVQDVLFQLQ